MPNRGPQFVSYNIHNMLHLANDVRKFDTLENFSAFEFESYIACIKQLIRSGNQPLKQIMRRCAEIELLNDTTLDINEGRFILTHPHVNGPIPNGLHDVKQYKTVKTLCFKVNCGDDKNNCVLVDKKYVINIINLIECQENEIYVVEKRMKIIGPLYNFPCASSDLGINIVSNEDNNAVTELWNLKRISAKLFKLPFENRIVVFPILHTFSNLSNGE